MACVPRWRSCGGIIQLSLDGCNWGTLAPNGVFVPTTAPPYSDIDEWLPIVDFPPSGPSTIPVVWNVPVPDGSDAIVIYPYLLIGSIGANTITLIVQWTDETGAAQTASLVPIGVAVGPWLFAPVTVRPKPGTAITLTWNVAGVGSVSYYPYAAFYKIPGTTQSGSGVIMPTCCQSEGLVFGTTYTSAPTTDPSIAAAQYPTRLGHNYTITVHTVSGQIAYWQVRVWNPALGLTCVNGVIRDTEGGDGIFTWTNFAFTGSCVECHAKPGTGPAVFQIKVIET